MMENRPEFIAIWLGLAKIGCDAICVCTFPSSLPGVLCRFCSVKAALLNTNLKGQPLSHSLNVSLARTVITGSMSVHV
jgi:hypothetical protein